MWQMNETEKYDRDLKQFRKTRSREADAAAYNLMRYFLALVGGAQPLQALSYAGHIHNEGKGVIAADQRGAGVKGKGKLAETRLYAYPEIETQTLHLITIGLKSEQEGDVRLCHQFVMELRERKSDG